MMEYNKPEFYVEEFAPNTAVTSCDTEEAGKELVYEPFEVECIVKGSDTIFVEDICSEDDGEHVVDLNNTSGDYVFYEHIDSDSCYPTSAQNDNHCNQNLEYGLYYIWKGPKANAGNVSTAPLTHLLKLAFGGNGSYDAGNNQYWHAGLAKGVLYQLYSHSY